MKAKFIIYIVFVMMGYIVDAQNIEKRDPNVNWKDLPQHKIPEWFEDSKFGIYAHLGVYSVPAYSSEWYPHNMYLFKDGKPTPVMEHHIATYGPLNKFGYKDFIPMFKAEKFNADAWADLYQKAGAKFGGVVTEHHDGFAMWDSKINEFNAVKMGPHKNIYGDMVNALRKRNIKILATFHHAFTFNGFYPENKNSDLDDPKFAHLYGRVDSATGNKRWLGQIKEVIDEYKPDQIWFDFDIRSIPDSWRYKFAQYYYDQEKKWNKQVIITRKHMDFPAGVGVLDVERGKQEKPADTLWQTDDALAINSWTWVDGLKLKPTPEVIHELIDIVSKNGVLLLNACPKADGTIPDDQQKMLLAIGDFLKVNGKAIYATRPWVIHGEGPHLYDKGRGMNKQASVAVQFTSEDIRFTRSKDGKKLYAIALGWPTGQLSIKSLGKSAGLLKNQIVDIKLLGENKNLTWNQNNDALVIHTSAKPAGQYAYAWEITLK